MTTTFTLPDLAEQIIASTTRRRTQPERTLSTTVELLWNSLTCTGAVPAEQSHAIRLAVWFGFWSVAGANGYPDRWSKLGTDELARTYKSQPELVTPEGRCLHNN